MKTRKPKKLLALLLSLIMVLSMSMTAFADESSAILTNFIASLSRDVEQDGKDLLYRNIDYTVVDSNEKETEYNGVDVYKVNSKENITVSYNATMDMTELGLNSTYLQFIETYASTQGESVSSWGAWEALLYCYGWISDSTYIDLVFEMDADVEVSKINTSSLAGSISLVSEMFTFDSSYTDTDSGFTNGLKVDSSANTLTIRCWWDSDKAAGNYDKDRTDCEYALDPMIYLYNVELPITSTWGTTSDSDGDEGNEDVLVIVNNGSVSGMMYGDSGNDNYNSLLSLSSGWEIYGGIEDDTFILTTDDSVKVSAPGIKKKILVTTETTDEDGNTTTETDEVDSYSVNAGDTVTFQLTSNVPDYLLDYITFGYTNNSGEEETGESTVAAASADDGIAPIASTATSGTYVITFHDVLDSAFELNEKSFTVTIGGETLDSGYYTLVFSGNTDDDGNTIITDDCTFELSMDLAALYIAGIIDNDDVSNAAKIVVTYTATLSSDATAGDYTNQAWVEYEGTTTDKPKVDVYVYGIKIYKIDEDGTTSEEDEDGNVTYTYTYLEGATFTLYSNEECTTVVKELTTDENGYLCFDGLAAGTYYLVETNAPDGYVGSTTPVVITLPENDDSVTSYYYESIINNAAIPNTGGMGTNLIYLAGVGLVLLAGVVLVTRKRRSAEAG